MLTLAAAGKVCGLIRVKIQDVSGVCLAAQRTGDVRAGERMDHVRQHGKVLQRIRACIGVACIVGGDAIRAEVNSQRDKNAAVAENGIAAKSVVRVGNGGGHRDTVAHIERDDVCLTRKDTADDVAAGIASDAHTIVVRYCQRARDVCAENVSFHHVVRGAGAVKFHCRLEVARDQITLIRSRATNDCAACSAGNSQARTAEINRASRIGADVVTSNNRVRGGVRQTYSPSGVSGNDIARSGSTAADNRERRGRVHAATRVQHNAVRRIEADDVADNLIGHGSYAGDDDAAVRIARNVIAIGGAESAEKILR